MNYLATSKPHSTLMDATQTWRGALWALLLLEIWIIFLYRETGVAMVEIWARSDTFNHAFMVPPIGLWLIWRARFAIFNEPPQASVGVLVLIIGASIIWLLANLVAVNAIAQLAFVGQLVLAVPAVLGWRVAKLIAFPLGFFFLSVPVGEFLIPQLMEGTANFTVLALRMSGIPVYRDGLHFIIPSGSWSVVEACSGVRYLIASFTVGSLFAYLNYQSTKRRIIFMLMSLLVPVIANWMRAYLIVLLGHLSGNKLAAGVDHLIYGWLFFGVVIFLMFVVGARWTEPEKLIERNRRNHLNGMQPSTTTRIWGFAASIAALLVLPHIAVWVVNQNERTELSGISAPATLAGDWRAVGPSSEAFNPGYRNPSSSLNSAYVSQGQAVSLYVGYYQRQSFQRKLISSSNVLVSPDDLHWVFAGSGSRLVPFGDQPVVIRTAELLSRTSANHVQKDRLLVWQVYWVNGVLFTSDHLAKAYGALCRLAGRGDDSAVIIVYAPQTTSGKTELVMASFLSVNYPLIHALLLNAQKSKRRELL